MQADFANNTMFCRVTVHGAIGPRFSQTWDQMETPAKVRLGKGFVKTGFVTHRLPSSASTQDLPQCAPEMCTRFSSSDSGFTMGAHKVSLK